MYDLIIIGGGVAGYSAGMYAGRLRLKTLILTESKGGTILNAGDITNWPGESKITGAELAMKLEEHAKEYGVEIKMEKVKEIEKVGGGFKLTTNFGSTYESKTILIATGTKVRKLGVKGEKEYEGKGVHYCALCDGMFYQGKTLVVVGGSDSAAKEALILSQWAEKIYLLARSRFRAEPINKEKVMKNEKIKVIEGIQVEEILGDGKKVTGVKVTKEVDGKKEISCDGVFVEIGRIINSELVNELGVSTNPKGEIITNKNSETNIPGVFAAGDVTDSRFKQAIISSAEGVAAAYSAYLYLQKK